MRVRGLTPGSILLIALLIIDTRSIVQERYSETKYLWLVEGWWNVFSKEGCEVEVIVKVRLKVTSARSTSMYKILENN